MRVIAPSTTFSPSRSNDTLLRSPGSNTVSASAFNDFCKALTFFDSMSAAMNF